MALRVLLADESTTIKKVMQLALQDFAVEVKAVHAGVDVVEVARSFQPEIIFADVLLQKKNGYEVSADLKRDPQLRSTPVVLMWSSFMDLDEALAEQCGADRRLEKPFDVEHLRQLILELVPKTRSQRMAHFLQFPQSVTEPMKNEEERKRQSEPQMRGAPHPGPAATPPLSSQPPYPQRPAASMPPPPPPPRASAPPEPPRNAVPHRPDPPIETTPSKGWNINSFDEVDDFAARLGEENLGNEGQDQMAERTASGAFNLSLDSDDSSSDEAFAEFRLEQPPASSEPVGLEGTRTTIASVSPPSQAPSQSASSSYDDPDEAWSHQDLSRFKIDLPPVSVENDEINLDIDVDEDELEGQEFLLRQDHLKFSSGEEKKSLRERIAQQAQPPPPTQSQQVSKGRPKSPMEPPDIGEDADSDAVHAYELTPMDEETKSLALSDLELQDSRPGYASNDRELLPPLESDQIPQLSSERLEEIIRAQSREIIESVVRRIVPDLATDIIRKELERLLEDTSAHGSGYGSRR